MLRIYLVTGFLLCALLGYANATGWILWDSIVGTASSPTGPGNHKSYHK